MNTKFHVDVLAFRRALDYVRKESGRSADEGCRYAMILMLTAGRNMTPVGMKNRPLMKQGEPVSLSIETEGTNGQGVSTFEQRATMGQSYYEVYYSNAPMRRQYLPFVRRSKKARQDPNNALALAARANIIRKFKEIAFRGTAKASWGWALWKAVGTNPAHGFHMRRRDPITVAKIRSDIIVTIEVTNALGWIEKLVPGIEQKMVDSATHRLEAWLEKRWQSGLDRAERMAA